jgi:hypothetical protein
MGWLKNLVGFQNSFTKNLGSDILSNPTRLLTGVDPASTKVWNTVLGRDDPALVNWFGSPGQQYYEQAEQEGIDTGAAQQFHSIADTIAGIYGANGLAGSLGFGGAGSASGPTNTSGIWNASNIGKVANSVTGADGQKNGSNNMGFLDSLLGSSGSGGSGLGGIAAGIGGALLGAAGNKSGSNQTQTTQQQLDPRVANILFGQNGNSGLLSQFQGLMNQPQTLGSGVAGNLSSNYLAGALPDDVTAIRNASLGLMDKKNAPNFNNPDFNNPMFIGTPTVQAAQVRAPSQNNLDLAAAYQNTIYGNPAQNKYLTDALQSGINQSNQAFQTQLGDITTNLQRNIMPSIRSNSVLSGQYGGSRQGIAEGLAMSDASKQATNAAQQIGLANIAATTGAQANAFESGQNRALSAMQGLGGQQYGVASQNANLEQQAALANMEANIRTQMANQASGNQAALANQAARLDTNRLNAGNILATNAQNTAATLGGIGSLQGLGQQMYGYNQAGQNADLTRAQGVSGLLAPFLGANSSTQSTQPLYQNTAANVLGGASAGLGLFNQFKGMFGGSGGAGGGGGANIGTSIANMFPNGY